MDYSQLGTVDPQILALLRQAMARNPSLRQQIGESDAGAYYGIDPASRQGDYYLANDEQGRPLIYRDLERNTWGQDVAAAYGMDGQPVGISSGDSTALGLTKFILSSLAAYGGVNAADGMVNGATAASTGGAGAAAPTMSAEQAAFLEANMGAGAPMAGMPGSAWYNAVQPVLGTEAGNVAYGAGNLLGGAGSTGLGSMPGGSGGASGGGSGGVGVGDVVKGVGGTGSLIGAGLGAVAGALDSKDKEATSSRDPWAPMQPYLLGLAEDGRGLYNQLKAQPFSQAQQTAYGNVGGLLDVLNQNAGGLLQGMQANATGQNQFVRGQPRALTGSAPIDGMAFTPGLLGNFGTRRG